MSYLLFNNDVYISDGIKVERVKKEARSFHHITDAHLCMVDADVFVAAASESALDKKDGILAKKFSESYQGDYILQDEKVDNNIFQVIGIKAEKVREVYSLIPYDKIISFVPYAVAVRKKLSQERFPANKVLIVLDDLGTEKLITVFEGLKFSRTRTVFNDKASEILSEIKRSVINFEKKLAEQKDKTTDGFIIVTNNKALAEEFKEAEKGLAVEIVESPNLALDGLKIGGLTLKYILPEEIIKKRRQQEARERVQSLVTAVSILSLGVFFFGYNRIALSIAHRSFGQEEHRKWQLEEELNKLDPYVYRNMLKQEEEINYALHFLNIANVLPTGYEVHAFNFHRKTGRRFELEEYLSAPDEGLYDPIPIIGPLEKANIKDMLVNNKPGKYLKVEL